MIRSSLNCSEQKVNVFIGTSWRLTYAANKKLGISLVFRFLMKSVLSSRETWGRESRLRWYLLKTCEFLSETEILLSFKLNEWQFNTKRLLRKILSYQSIPIKWNVFKKSYKPINWGIKTLAEDLNTNRRFGCCWHGFESGLCVATWTGSNIGTMATNLSYFLIKSDFALFSGSKEHHSCRINW